MNDEQKKQFAKHCENAVGIYENGACNPRAIFRKLVEAADFATEQSGNSVIAQRQDFQWAPVRLMFSQQAYLIGQGIGNYDLVNQDLELCKRAIAIVKEEVVPV